MNYSNKFISAAALARAHEVSMSTIRRRIVEGRLFPGAKKSATAAGEIWLIPLSEARTVTLKQIAPKVHYRRSVMKLESGNTKPLSLENRVARLEDMAADLLDSDLKQDVS